MQLTEAKETLVKWTKQDGQGFVADMLGVSRTLVNQVVSGAKPMSAGLRDKLVAALKPSAKVQRRVLYAEGREGFVDLDVSFAFTHVNDDEAQEFLDELAIEVMSRIHGFVFSGENQERLEAALIKAISA